MPLYNLVIAPHDAAQALAASSSPLLSYTGFDCKPIDHVKLATLSELLRVSSYETALEELDPAAAASDNGPWVSLLPKSLLEEVARLDFVKRGQIASAWGATEEFQLDRVGAAEADSFLVSLARLWRQADSEGSHIFLWACV
jgi:hypothetical protein